MRWARHGDFGVVEYFVELMNIAHIKFPLWLAYDHWTGLGVAVDSVGREIMASSYRS